MTKILQVSAQSDWGGGERVMFDIVNGLKDQFYFLIIGPFGETLNYFQEKGFKTYHLSSKNFLGKVLTIRKIILKEKPDIIHSHGTRAAFWTRLALFGLKNRPNMVYTLHGFHLPRKNVFIRKFILLGERFLNKWTDILVCVSESDRILVLSLKTISPTKIRIIKNGIDVKKFEVNPEIIQKTKKEMELENKFVLSSIGRLHPQKDFYTVLRAVKIVASQLKDIKLLIVGGGPLRKQLEKERENLGLRNEVEFLGFRKDIPTVIGISDIVILSTNWEGLPLICLEAGAGKKPIIASDIDGVRETVIHKKTGFLFTRGSAKDLAGKILKLYQSQNLRKKMGENAFEFVLSNFSKENMVEKYHNLYLSLL